MRDNFIAIRADDWDRIFKKDTYPSMSKAFRQEVYGCSREEWKKKIGEFNSKSEYKRKMISLGGPGQEDFEDWTDKIQKS